MFDLISQFDLWLLVVLFGVAFIAGTVDGMGGPGGLLLFPFLMLMGVPPATAIGSGKASTLGNKAIVITVYHRAQQVCWAEALPLILVAIAGGALGASITVSIPESTLYVILAVLFIAILPLTLKDTRKLELSASIKASKWAYLGYFCCALYSGFFGPGTSVFAFLVLTRGLALLPIEAVATHVLAHTFLTLTAVGIFAWHGHVDLVLVALLFIAMLLGGWVGAHITLKNGHHFVRKVVAISAFVMSIGLLIKGIQLLSIS